MPASILSSVGLLCALVGWLDSMTQVASQESTGEKEKDVNGPIEMPNLGRGFTLGSLYDARVDKRIGGYLWPLSVFKDPKYVKEVNAKNARYKFAFDDSFSSKMGMMEIGSSLAVKVKTAVTVLGQGGGSDFNLQGSSKFLGDSRTSAKEVRASVAYRLRSFQQNLDVFHPDLRTQLYPDVVAEGRATHVVSSITWGADCIATFSKKTSSLKQKADMESFMAVGVQNMVDVDVPIIVDVDHEVGVTSVEKNKFSGRSFDSSLGISVNVQGDVMPFGNETLPTDVTEAVAFLKRLHLHGVGDGGVPMDLVLVPIAWLDDKAARVERKIDGSKIDEALSIFNALDESVESMNDVLEIETDGFLAWAREVKLEIDQLMTFRSNYTLAISNALDYFSRSGDATKLTELFEEYYACPFRTSAIQKIVETRRDEIVNLKALVSSLRVEAGVPAAEHFSDYMAPSLNQKYTTVYALLLTGMNPSVHRESISLVRDFTAMARSVLQSRDPITYCLSATVNEETVCLEHYMFGSIHFDTFCEQFCPEAFCSPKPRECTDPTASAALDFGEDREAWCQNPCTMILEFPKNMAPIRGDTRLPVLPGMPTITAVEGAQDPIEPNPLYQKVTLRVSISGRGAVNNYRVRVIWLVQVSEEGTNRWVRSQKEFDTPDDHTVIVVRGLTAGREYTFQVAGMNLVGVGPFSDEYRTEDDKMVLVAHNMATISPVEEFPIPRVNKGPSFKSVRYQVALSMPGEEPIGSVRFVHPDGTELKCQEYKDATLESVTCLMPQQHSTQDTTYDVVISNANEDEEIAWGTFTHEALSGLTCYSSEFQKRLLCNATRRCVQACSECNDITMSEMGTITQHNTSEVVKLRHCSSDVCPGADLWCPTPEALDPCFTPSFGKTDESCQKQCNGFSKYNADFDMCALPCGLDIKGIGLSQKCSTVMPGTSCTIECAEGYTYAINTQAVTFRCEESNNKPKYRAGDKGLRFPTCAALCSRYICSEGWKKLPLIEDIVGASDVDCCNETLCAPGTYGPALIPSCGNCNGETRRRRATSCTDCPIGRTTEEGSDDCVPFCKSFLCTGYYAPREQAETIEGSRMEDCCEEVDCAAGLYHPTGSSSCASCSGAVRRRRADSCTGCPSGYAGVTNSDDCAEVTCGAGYYRSGSSCHSCNGVTRRRRSTSCTGCPSNYEDNGNNDDCRAVTSVSGFSRNNNRDCVGGDMPNGQSTADLKACGSSCSGRWDCGAFAYRFDIRSCKLKWTGHCSEASSSAWTLFKKR